LGLPAEWAIIEGWLTDKTLPEPPSTVSNSKPEAKEKSSVTVKNKVDWDTFPKKDIPAGPETRIDIKKLQNMVDENENNLLDHEVRRARRAISYLEEGAPAHQLRRLKSCLVKNKIPSSEANSAVLETVASWIKEGFVAAHSSNHH
jgi:hypothetical protein